MLDDSWLMAQGSWLMAKGGRPDPGAQGGGGAGPGDPRKHCFLDSCVKLIAILVLKASAF